MDQVLFTIPPGIPVYGYGTMLFVAFVACTMLATRLGRRVGIPGEVFQELVLWLFVFGIVGARIMFIIYQIFWEGRQFRSPLEYFAVWDGGLVFYGSFIGGVIGYLVVDRFLQRKYPFDRWKLLDVAAPCVALGLAIGRLGCLLNGCCYGNVACEKCPSITFPLAAPPRFDMVMRGYQSPAGFTVDRDMQRKVALVESGSPAAAVGLKVGDKIVKVNDIDVVRIEKGREDYGVLHEAFRGLWPRGKNDLVLTIQTPAGQEQTLDPIRPRTIPLHPTQLYETISMSLLLFFLVAWFPYRRHDGILMVFFMFGYGVHRFLNEMLRTDTEKVAFNMTLSQNISLIVLAAAVLLAIGVWRHRGQATAAA